MTLCDEDDDETRPLTSDETEAAGDNPDWPTGAAQLRPLHSLTCLCMEYDNFEYPYSLDAKAQRAMEASLRHLTPPSAVLPLLQRYETVYKTPDGPFLGSQPVV